jgi:hypothetical protein
MSKNVFKKLSILKNESLRKTLSRNLYTKKATKTAIMGDIIQDIKIFKREKKLTEDFEATAFPTRLPIIT